MGARKFLVLPELCLGRQRVYRAMAGFPVAPALILQGAILKMAPPEICSGPYWSMTYIIPDNVWMLDDF
ncbi:MAG: hypothetical protein F4Z69_06425 [Bacteroidetes bacterium SB0668_bin_1]|nr:hypothetical protein [Bacteroidetes bacterium SB0668_bin_1]